MRGGNFSLDGGFWGITAPATYGPPTLKITRSGNSVVLSWPSPYPDFYLQQNAKVSNASGWSYAAANVSDDGINKSVTITAPIGTVFFRQVKGGRNFTAAYSVLGFPEHRASQQIQQSE